MRASQHVNELLPAFEGCTGDLEDAFDDLAVNNPLARRTVRSRNSHARQ
jgi:hypothetical protein